MTILTFTDRKYRRSPRNPLLPQKHDGFESVEGFDGASFSGAVFNLSTTIVGAGIMALPATLKQLGMIPGLIAIILGAMLTESSIDMLLRFTRASKSASYAGLVGDAFGGSGRTLLQVCIVINNMGLLVVYMIIIGDVLSGTWLDGAHHSGVMEEWFGQHWWTSRSVLMLLTTLFVLAPLISFKRVDSKYKTRDTTIDDVGGFESVELSVLLCNDEFISKLNKEWRDEDRATDVLSMSQHIPGLKLPILMLGDIVIFVEPAARQAEERAHTLIDQIRILMVHGFLHLLGFDHEISDEAEAEMEKEEELLLKSLEWRGKGLIQSAYDAESNGSPHTEKPDGEILTCKLSKDRKKEGSLRFYKPKFKYNFCDMDGTLLNSKSQITSPTAKALKEATSRGVKVVIATGKVRTEDYSLRYTSALSVGLAIVFVVITAGVAVVKLINGSIRMPQLLPEFVDQASFWKLFTTVPVLVTAYICHHNIHPIENELTDPAQMKSIVRTSLTLCSSVYIATSFFGFLLFGPHTLDDVLANFDGDLGIPYSSFLNDVVRVSYGLHLMLVFPIVFFSLRLNLDGLLFPHAIPITFDSKRFFLVTAGLMGFIFLGANFVPSIWDAFQFTGATATVSIGFIFPAAIALRDTHGIATKNDKLVSWVMIVLAVSSSTVAITSDIYNIFITDKEVGR